ncbi:MAG: cell division protein ZapB [Deferribacteres bacterium]|nr:cell division protein ZapB [candidate division KSB1 bacterium]MCB9501403.1 cell division protein ZapB [Deferribacteres bacterium]
MDFKQFNLLEHKILQALDSIQALKNENVQLQERVQSLEQEIEEKKDLINELQKEHDSIQSNEGLTEREVYISNKIDEMLKRIDALDTEL